MDQLLTKSARMNRLTILREKRARLSYETRTPSHSRRPLNDISNVYQDYGESSIRKTQVRAPNAMATSFGYNINGHMNIDGENNSNFDLEGYGIIDDNDELNEDDINNDIEGDDELGDVIGFKDYWDIGDPMYTCEYCNAIMWFEERARKDRKTNPKFSQCCMQGKVQIPKLQDPPQILRDLYTNHDARSKNFQDNTRPYNMMYAFTSMGGKIDSFVNRGRGPFTFRLYGQNYHRIGSLLPMTGSSPKFSQLYIYDTENEVSNRMHAFSSNSTRNNALDDTIVEDLRQMFDEYNPLAQAFRVARDRFESNNQEAVKLRLIGGRETDGRTYNLPTASEVAALIVGDVGSSVGERDIIVETKSGQLQRINELHPSYLPLQYPLLFPYGEDGYRLGIQLRDSTSINRKRKKLTMREFFAFRIHEREDEAFTILWSRKLFQQFCVDGFTMIESERMCYIRTHQKQLRVDKYKNLKEVPRQNTNSSSTGKPMILPSSFTGCARYNAENYKDAMAICKWYGYPDLFITFTCNPKWPEILRYVQKRGLKPEDRPDILCRIFKIKLDQLIRDLKEGKIFGKAQALVYTIEFQKRGLPHAHIVLFLRQEDKFPNADDIDKVISAEIPDQETYPDLYILVRDSMFHGPCGAHNIRSPCMKDGKCSKHFPKKFIDRTTVDDQGYPMYRRRNNGRTVEKNGVLLDNRYVVPYNPSLLMKYGAHINVEWCNQSRAIKYLFKYISKGHDRVTASLSHTRGDDGNNNDKDEIKSYYDCRYISPCEAVWRILGYDIHYRTPSVERLSFHLPDEQSIVFEDDEPLEDVMNKSGINSSMFLKWMDCNKKSQKARNLTYCEFPTEFVWHKKGRKEWRERDQRYSIGRIYYVPPGSGELYYLSSFLNIVKGPTCYEDIRTVNGVLYSTFKEACYALGLLEDDKEYIDGITEASFWGSAQYLRTLFVTLLISGSMSRPEFVYEQIWKFLADDVLFRQRSILQITDLMLSEEQLKDHTLALIENLLQSNGRSLSQFPPMPLPDHDLVSHGLNKLIQGELCYDRTSMDLEHKRLSSCLTDEQKGIYDEIMNALAGDEGGVFFLYGYGGTGKTFMWKTLSAAIRSQGEIVLNVASSGIASLLLPGGRTAHSRFAIPINVTENTTCEIKQRSPLADLLIKTKLIIWDEAPMVHRFCFEALDRSLRDIMRFSNPKSMDQPFGGKVVVFGGDFRQILPVIPKGSRQDIVFSSINSSYIWDYCRVLSLTQNMRLQVGSSHLNLNEIKEFSEWILRIGDGKEGEPNDGEAIIKIPDELLIKDEVNSPVASIVESVYPFISHNLDDAKYFQERAILVPTNECVEVVNEHLLSIIPGEEKIYLSSDNICASDRNVRGNQELYTSDFLNTIKCSGLPNHTLKLKIGVPVMLLRNIDQPNGLCNGTRLVITQLGNHIIEAKIISGNNIGHKVFIPRMLFADDIVLVDETKDGVNVKLEQWRQRLESRGFKLSRNKTEYLVCRFGTQRGTSNEVVSLDGKDLTMSECFKYLGSIIQKNGDIDQDVTHRIKSGWLKWRAATGVLCDRSIPLQLKGKFYRAAIRPVLLYGTECWASKKEYIKKMEVTEMRMLRWMCGNTLRDRIRNEAIRKKVGVAGIADKLRENRLRWFGHVRRRPEGAPVRRVEEWDHGGIKRGRGRPKMTWLEGVRKDMKCMDLREDEVLDRKGWRRKIYVDDYTE